MVSEKIYEILVNQKDEMKLKSQIMLKTILISDAVIQYLNNK
jgi:hypothetical protein